MALRIQSLRAKAFELSIGLVLQFYFARANNAGRGWVRHGNRKHSDWSRDEQARERPARTVTAHV